MQRIRNLKSKAMERTMKISYNWKCDQGIEIPDGHIDELEEFAQYSIFDMIIKGYHEGELSTTIKFGIEEEDEEEGLSYSGWWKLLK